MSELHPATLAGIEVLHGQRMARDIASGVERWVGIIGGWYEVSSLGAFRSWRNGRWPTRRKDPRPMRVTPTHHRERGVAMGPRIEFKDGGEIVKTTAARAVLTAFAHPLAPGFDRVCRLNGDQDDYGLPNLIWGDYGTAAKVRVSLDSYASGEDHWKAKLTSDDVRMIRSLDVTAQVTASMFSVCVETIYKVRARRVWKAVR